MERAAKLNSRADWMAETRIQIIISEGQNEVNDFTKWASSIS